MNSFPATGRKKRGRPQKQWRDTVISDLRAIDLTWQSYWTDSSGEAVLPDVPTHVDVLRSKANISE